MMDNEEISKYQAERLLGLSGSYSYKELRRAYRKAVKKNHPDVGGSEDAMVRVNKANSKLEGFFAYDKTIRITCDTYDRGDGARSETSSAQSSGSTHTESAGNGSQNKSAEQSSETSADAEKASPPPPIGRPVSGVKPPAGQERDYYRTREAEVVSAAISGIGDLVSRLFGFVFGSAFRRDNIEGAPQWWKRANFMASWFPWRTVLWTICGIYGFIYTFFLSSSDLVAAGVLWIAALATVINVFGIITNPIRDMIRKRADKKLMKWAIENNKVIDWGMDTIYDDGSAQDKEGVA